MDFRTILREATRPEHDHLDCMFTALDIAKLDGFASFVKVHLTCFQLMAKVAVDGSYSHKSLCQMVNCLALDLDVLGGRQTQTGIKLSAKIDPLAIDYLVAGSRLGSKVLRKRWSGSDDPIVRRSNHYFGLDSNAVFWQLTCKALAEIYPDSHRAKVITRDTKILFRLFSTVYENADAKEAAVV
tara:strand:- start:25 stop:576 length:552 start_codon:yes stop_codon:yes gene_type:complete